MRDYEAGASYLDQQAARSIDEKAKRSTFNKILDGDRDSKKVDLLSFVPDDHVIKRMVLHVHNENFMPTNSIFLMAIATLSSVTCKYRTVAYQNSDDFFPIGIYAVAEQKSGEGKGWCLSRFKKPIIKAMQKAKKKVYDEISRIESASDNIDDDLIALKKLKQFSTASIFVTDATPEALDSVLTGQNGFFSVVSSEQGAINAITGASYGNNRQNNNELILNGFDGGYVSGIRVGRKAYSGNVVGAFVVFSQYGSIEKIVGNTDEGTGYTQRFIFLSEPTNFNKDYHRKVAENKGLMVDYEKIFEFASDVIADQKNIEDMPRLTISDNGWWYINEYRNRIEKYKSNGGAYSSDLISGFVGKINMHIGKWAANLHLSSQHRFMSQIQDDYVLGAISIVNALLKEMASVYRAKGILGQKAEFVAILSLFELNQSPRTERNIIQVKNKCHPFKTADGNKSELIRQTLAEMVDQGVLKMTYTIDNTILYSLAQ